MKKLKYFIIIIFVIFLTGCSYKEINDLAIASALGIDYENKMYTISAQVLNIKKEGSQEKTSSSFIYIGSGKTIAEAIRNIGLQYPKTLYLGHLQLLIIGKGELEHGIEKTFDYLIRTTETRNDATIIISDTNDAKEILNPNEETKEEFPVKDILTTVENSMKRNGKVVKVNLEEFVSTYLQEGISPITTAIKIEKTPNNEYKDTALEGIAVFRHNKFIGILNEKEAIAYNTLNQNYYDIDITIPYKNEILSIAVFKPKSNIDLKIKNNKININLNINLDGHILEYNEKNDLTDNDLINKLEQSVNQEIKNYIQSLIEYNKNNNVDVLGFKNLIYKQYYKDYPKYKDQNIYKIANININVNTNIYRFGNIDKGFIGEKYGK